jgi:hypothetical protein
MEDTNWSVQKLSQSFSVLDAEQQKSRKYNGFFLPSSWDNTRKLSGKVYAMRHRRRKTLGTLEIINLSVSVHFDRHVVCRVKRILRYPPHSPSALGESEFKFQAPTALTFRNRVSLYIGRAHRYAPHTPFYIFFSTNIRTEFFKHAAHTPFFSLQNAVYFIMLTFLVPV